MKKIINVLGSKNALITILNIVFFAIRSNGIDVGVDGETTIDTVTTQNLLDVLVFLVINFSNVATKLVQKILAKDWDWAFLKSDNFKTQVFTIVTLVVTAVSDEIVAGIVISLIANIINLITHILEKDDSN